tara:strand:+ start:10285 stop:10449 length:165 start_codon:yes stop_codon:yes gene_type:complete
MSAKRGKYNKDTPARQSAYLRGLSSSVSKACDAWLDKKGLKSKSWKKQADEKAK